VIFHFRTKSDSRWQTQDSKGGAAHSAGRCENPPKDTISFPWENYKDHQDVKLARGELSMALSLPAGRAH
jgi:hypothetical protein